MKKPIRMGKGLLLVSCLAALVAGCATDSGQTSKSEPAPIAKPAPDYNKYLSEAKDPYLLGYHITYSEICKKDGKEAADQDQITALTNRYLSNENFSRGYAQNRDALTKDFMFVLKECKKAKGIVSAAFDHYFK